TFTRGARRSRHGPTSRPPQSFPCSNCRPLTNQCDGMIERRERLTLRTPCVACAVTPPLPTWPQVRVDKRESGNGRLPHDLRGRGLGRTKRLQFGQERNELLPFDDVDQFA